MVGGDCTQRSLTSSRTDADLIILGTASASVGAQKSSASFSVKPQCEVKVEAGDVSTISSDKTVCEPIRSSLWLPSLRFHRQTRSRSRAQAHQAFATMPGSKRRFVHQVQALTLHVTMRESLTSLVEPRSLITDPD